MPRKHFRRPSRILAATVAITALASGAAGPAVAAPTDTNTTAGLVVSGSTRSDELPEHRSCAEPGEGEVRCLSEWRGLPDSVAPYTAGTSAAAVAPPATGLGPADIRAAYQLPATGGANQTIAIVAAFDNPTVEADLAAYRAAWGLPACTTANGCFRKVDQNGGSDLPPADAGWGVEIALDVQAVSAACSACRILLVEADDPSFESLGIAVNTAVELGADVVSNSYGADEFGDMVALGEKYYTHPGVPIIAASGDLGFRVASYPAVLDTTWAIGGTLLNQNANGTWVEEAWSGSGSACSAWIPKPSTQKDTSCSMRTVADISATAASGEGFAVYNTHGMGEEAGWITVGGTSLAAPLVAGMIGLAGNAARVADPSYPYQHPEGLFDVVGGINGFCGGDYLCTGVPGYDAPTGLGSPRGLASL